LPFLYFFTPPADFCEIFAPKSYPPRKSKDTRRWIVSAGVIAGVVLVFLLLGYLVYALIMRRHSDGCSGIFTYCQLSSGVVVLARPLGRAGENDDVPLPGLAGSNADLARLGFAQEMNWRSI
jgi:K+-transporting ATPase ATPase F chain